VTVCGRLPIVREPTVFFRYRRRDDVTDGHPARRTYRRRRRRGAIADATALEVDTSSTTDPPFR
jgi:hypothetical protein